MLRKLFKGFITILGGMIGYEIFDLISYFAGKSSWTIGEPFSTEERLVVESFFVIIFAIVFYRFAPKVDRESKKVAADIGKQLKGTSATEITGGIFGVTAGLVISYLITRIFTGVIPNATLNITLSIVIYLVLGYLGFVVGKNTGPEMIAYMASLRKPAAPKTQVEETNYSYNPKEKKNRTPKILDTSVIIDGRILEIMKTGFFEGPVIIPEFVLVELRHIADSSDSLKRTKGRRGLDILNKIQTEYGIEIYNTDSEKALKEIPEVDVKLLKLAQIMKGKVVTNDFNLNKVAAIKGVPVLNINELSNAVKPMVIAGETMEVTLIKQGKDRRQAIAYLDDGTMIVVEEGRDKIGKNVEIVVTSVLQTAAGRMIFGRIK